MAKWYQFSPFRDVLTERSEQEREKRMAKPFAPVPFQPPEPLVSLPDPFEPVPSITGGCYTYGTGQQPELPIPASTRLRQQFAEPFREAGKLVWQPERAEEGFQDIWSRPPEGISRII